MASPDVVADLFVASFGVGADSSSDSERRIVEVEIADKAHSVVHSAAPRTAVVASIFLVSGVADCLVAAVEQIGCYVDCFALDCHAIGSKIVADCSGLTGSPADLAGCVEVEGCRCCFASAAACCVEVDSVVAASIGSAVDCVAAGFAVVVADCVDSVALWAADCSSEIEAVALARSVDWIAHCCYFEGAASVPVVVAFACRCDFDRTHLRNRTNRRSSHCRHPHSRRHCRSLTLGGAWE